MTSAVKRAKVTKKSTSTRSFTQYYFIGLSKGTIGGSKLPTFRQILLYILHLQEISPHGHPVKTSIARAVNKVLLFWMMARMKTVGKQHAKGKLF